jgi:hypothetical protein
MQDFETQAEDSETKGGDQTDALERSKNMIKYMLRRFILIISFGPGVLGFLWLLGRIVKR